jgi:hypothetical protein
MVSTVPEEPTSKKEVTICAGGRDVHVTPHVTAHGVD